MLHHEWVILLPIKLETLARRRPWGNWILMALCVLFWLITREDQDPEQLRQHLRLDWERPLNFAFNLIYHDHWMKLVVSLLGLWVFGNTLCATLGSVLYGLLFLWGGILAGMVQLALGESMTVGALGAAHAVVGATCAIYPKNVLRFFTPKARRHPGDEGDDEPLTSELPLLVAAVLEVLTTLLAIWLRLSFFPWWAHLGGFVAGLTLGMLCDAYGWFDKVRWENPTLLQMIRSHRPAEPPQP